MKQLPAIEIWQDRQNSLLFGLRSFLKWGRGTYHEKSEDKQDLFRDVEAETIANTLIERYGLRDFYKTSGRARLVENLTVLLQLETLLGTGLPQADKLRWLDVGAKNWSYVEALYRFMAAKHTGAFTLNGLEVDAFRRYVDFHNRQEYAEGFIRHLPNTYYRAADVMQETRQYEVITNFLPFVLKAPLRQWGLPDKLFQPGAMLAHLTNCLTPGGLLLLVNQGEAEAGEQRRLLENNPGLLVREAGALPDPFRFYRHTRYGFCCVRVK